MPGVSSNTGVSDYANTTDGRALGVSALNSGIADSVGGHGVTVQYSAEPGAIRRIATESNNIINTQDSKQIIIQP